jgi:hypothetical protein
MLALTISSIDLTAQTARRPQQRQRPDPMTASVQGTVTSADTRTPVRGAEVRLNSPGSYRRLATTDGDGRFELTNLPAGEYFLNVSSAGFASMQFGQRRPLDAAAAIRLSEGERFTADVALPRGAAIYGRVFDQFGEPVAGTRVQALRSRIVDGRRRLQSVGAGDQTDDTGAYRVYGLPPGDYFITASAGPPDAVRRDPPVYYPGTASFAEAQPVTLGAGGDTAADFQLMPVRNARVSGVVLNASGNPIEAMVQLTSEAVGIGFAVEGSSFRPAMMISGDTGPDGRFTLDNVPPGPYVLRANSSIQAGIVAGIQAANPGAGPNRAMQELIARGPETAVLPLVVAGDDIADITLTTRPGGILTGRFVADSGVVRPIPTGLRVDVRWARGGGGMSMMQGGRGNQFRLVGMSGPFHLAIENLPEGWAVSRITVDGADVTDEPIDLNGRNAAARIVLTDRVTSVTGIVQSRDEATQHSVLVFSEDQTRWAYPTRYVRAARAGDGGRFRITGLPPDERYLALAVDYLEEGEEYDPQLLERLRSRATSFSLSEGEEQSLVLDPVAR